MCNCNKLAPYINIPSSREEFTQSFDLIDQASDLWAELFKCKNCGQYWFVEDRGGYDRNPEYAFKISAPENWKSFDTIPGRKILLTKENGGTSNNNCIWAECKEKALIGKSVCVTHAYNLNKKPHN